MIARGQSRASAPLFDWSRSPARLRSRKARKIGRAQIACAQGLGGSAPVYRDKAERRREIEQRLAFIACRPFRERRVDHINVMARSGVPVDQASSDLHRCIALVPGNMVGEQSARAHVRGPDLDGRFCSAADDSDWHSEVTLEVAPHPELSETQARVIPPYSSNSSGKVACA